MTVTTSEPGAALTAPARAEPCMRGNDMPECNDPCRVCGNPTGNLPTGRKRYYCSTTCRGEARTLRRRAGHDVGDPTTAVPRFLNFVAVHATTGCWLWTGTLSMKGYGRFNVTDRNNAAAHRFAYESFVGPIPDGLEIDHLCSVRRCVNPAHLEPVTHAENLRRGAERRRLRGGGLDHLGTVR